LRMAHRRHLVRGDVLHEDAGPGAGQLPVAVDVDELNVLDELRLLLRQDEVHGRQDGVRGVARQHRLHDLELGARLLLGAGHHVERLRGPRAGLGGEGPVLRREVRVGGPRQHVVELHGGGDGRDLARRGGGGLGGLFLTIAVVAARGQRQRGGTCDEHRGEAAVELHVTPHRGGRTVRPSRRWRGPFSVRYARRVYTRIGGRTVVRMTSPDDVSGAANDGAAVSPARLVVLTTGGTISCTSDRQGHLLPTLGG